MGGHPFLGPFEGVGPKISTFLGPNGTRCARCHFRAQQSLDFRAHPFKRPSLWISPHPNPYVPPHINNRYINSYKSAVTCYLAKKASFNQCCGSGSGIRCLFDPWIRDPGGMGKKSRSGSGMNIPYNIFGLKYLNSLMRKRSRDPGSFLSLDPGWKKFGFAFRDKHPGSATLLLMLRYVLTFANHKM
jgi:hypothetical protein